MPAKKKTPTDHLPSSASDFKSRVRAVLELPSGLRMKVRNPGGMQTYLSSGRIPNTLMPIVQQGLKQGGVEQDAVAEMAEDPKALADMMDMVNMMVIDTAQDPKVYPVPDDEDDRDDELLYVDELTEGDRMFIFNWVNSGVSDLARFRQ